MPPPPPIPSRCRLSETSFCAFREITQYHFNVDRMAAILFVLPIRPYYSRRLTKAHELQRACYLFPGYANCAHSRVRSLPDDDSRTTAERVICFQGTQTVPVAARNDRLTPQQRIVTRIIWDISRCPHGPVVTQFYCPAPHFYLPRDVGTCLSLSPDEARDMN